MKRDTDLQIHDLNFEKNKLRKRKSVGTDFQSLFEVDYGQL